MTCQYHHHHGCLFHGYGHQLHHQHCHVALALPFLAHPTFVAVAHHDLVVAGVAVAVVGDAGGAGGADAGVGGAAAAAAAVVAAVVVAAVHVAAAAADSVSGVAACRERVVLESTHDAEHRFQTELVALLVAVKPMNLKN